MVLSKEALAMKRLYDSTRWRKIAKRHLDANPLCVLCAAMGRDTAANTVDHVVPHNGDPVLFWDEDNFQSLCAVCHAGIKRQQERHGYSAAADVDGNPRDAAHPWNMGKK